MDVAVIGLGGMGSGLASSLLRNGHKVSVWNRSPGPADALAAQGATRLDTPDQAFEGEAVLTMLANDEAVRDVILDSGALTHARAGLVHIVCATISVELGHVLEHAHAEVGVDYVAAPVLGRPDVAGKGELNVLAAGAPGALAKAQPLLDAIGKRTWPVGEKPHKANVAKLCANFLIASAIESMAEAFTLAQKNALDPHVLLEVLTGTLFAAPIYKTYGALVVDRQFEPAGFKLALGLKDVRLVQQAAEAAGAPMPIAALLRDNFVDAIAHGDGDKDWSALATVASRRAGLQA